MFLVQCGAHQKREIVLKVPVLYGRIKNRDEPSFLGCKKGVH